MNNPIEGLEGLPDEQKTALMTQIEEMQVRDRRAIRLLQRADVVSDNTLKPTDRNLQFADVQQRSRTLL